MIEESIFPSLNNIATDIGLQQQYGEVGKLYCESEWKHLHDEQQSDEGRERSFPTFLLLHGTQTRFPMERFQHKK